MRESGDKCDADDGTEALHSLDAAVRLNVAG